MHDEIIKKNKQQKKIRKFVTTSFTLEI